MSFKEYSEIVDETRPLSGYFLTDADFFLQKCKYNHETKQSSKFQSDLACNSLFSYFLIVICISFYTKFWSIVTCEIWGIGLLLVQYLFKKK